jgi:hypothetical protein
MLAGAGVLAIVSVGTAHDFWIVPDAFQVAANSVLSVRTVTGTRFPESESPVSPARVAEARILGATQAADDSLGDFAVMGKSLVIRHRPVGNGQRVIAMALQASTRAIAGEAFARYLRVEGAPALADKFSREVSNVADSIEMRSAKYAKTLVQVGSGGARAFAREAGHPVEFVPVSDPAALRAGDTLALKVLARGQLLAGASVHAGRAADAGEQPPPDLLLTAGPDGVVRLPINHDGIWNVRTANTVRSTESRASARPLWDVAWATFVFRVDSTSEAH